MKHCTALKIAIMMYKITCANTITSVYFSSIMIKNVKSITAYNYLYYMKENFNGKKFW